MIVCLPPFPPENLISREGFDRPVPHQPAINDRRENEEIILDVDRGQNMSDPPSVPNLCQFRKAKGLYLY